MLQVKYHTVSVHDLEEAVRNHEARFGMQSLAEPTHNPIGNFRMVPMGYGDQVVLNLISPVDESSPIHRLMQERTNPLNPHGEGRGRGPRGVRPTDRGEWRARHARPQPTRSGYARQRPTSC
jgi:hypothetical protein